MVAIGKKNACDTHTGDGGEGFVTRRYGIDAQVALAVANQIAVEVVPVRFGEPCPSIDIGNYFVHRATSALTLARFTVGFCGCWSDRESLPSLPPKSTPVTGWLRTVGPR